MVRICDKTTSLNEVINIFVDKGRVANPLPKSKKATQKLEAMSHSELVKFVKFTFSPTGG